MKSIYTTILVILFNSSYLLAENGTENAVFMPGPSTEDAQFAVGGIGDIPTTDYGAPLENYTPTDRPSWDVEVASAPPISAVADLPQEFWDNLKEAHRLRMIKIMVAKGIIKNASEATANTVRFISKARSGLAFDEITLYSITIEAHARALFEGKDPMYYVDRINAKSTDSPRLIRDAQRCKDRFEIYSGDDKSPCSRFPTHELAERHYDSSLKTLEERDATIAWLNAINQDLARQLADANSTIVKLQAQIKKLKKGRK